MEEPIAEGELVALLGAPDGPVVVPARRGPQPLGGRGVVDLTAAVGSPPGVEISWAGIPCRVVRPSLGDRLGVARRKAQVVLPKDAAWLVASSGIGPGARVAEAGAGSGHLTLVLAHFVGPTGQVHSYDRRADFLEVARANVAAAGLADRVRWAERDVVADGFDAVGLDAIVLDLPEPWAVAAAARTALRVGGYLATYTPTYNQLERAVRALREAGFSDVRSAELLERPIHVGEGGTRPEFEMLGHTAFLTVGRRGA